jgi:hypothetical protein
MSQETGAPQEKRSAAKIIFIEWLAVPRSQRHPNTRRELAEVLEIPESTLVRWGSELGIRLRVLEAIRLGLPLHYLEVVDAIVGKAKEGNTPAAILCGEIGWDEGKTRQLASAQSAVTTLPYRNWWGRTRRLPVDHLADAIGEVVKKAEKGDVSAARLYIYLAFDLKPEDYLDLFSPPS